jgi:hypothetical protein
MKMKFATLVVIVSLVVTGCNFSKSVKKDLISGLLTKGDGISCDDVYLSVNDEKTERNTFVYGEEFLVNFNNIEGFTRENESVFPGMTIAVTGLNGDTVLKAGDLYSNYTGGLKYTPLKLTSDITVASPMKSGNKYTLNVIVWDKKGKGTYNATLDFSVITNENIKIESVNVTYDEIYMYSEKKGKVITDNKIAFDDNTYFIFEGLAGFKTENGMVFPGLSLKGRDDAGDEILNFDDLFADYSESGLAVSDFNARLSSHFNIPKSEFKNPLKCNLTVWDKKSDARITVKAELTLE